MGFCAKCGSQLKDTDERCGNCGAEVLTKDVENGFLRNGLTEQQISRMVKQKAKKARLSITMSLICYLAFLAELIIAIVESVKANDVFDGFLSFTVNPLGIIVVISAILSVINIQSALSKFNKKQMLEGKIFTYAKIGKVMAIFSSLLLCISILLFFIAIFCIIYFLTVGLGEIIEFFDFIG